MLRGKRFAGLEGGRRKSELEHKVSECGLFQVQMPTS